MIVYLNGSYVDAAGATVSLFDGGYLFGDGLYETLRLYGGRPHDLEGHLARLARELELLGYEWRPQADLFRAVLGELAIRNGLADQDTQARLTVSRGGGPERPLPLERFGELPPTVSVFLLPIPAEYAIWQREGISVSIMKPVFARGNFPQLKTLNYLPPVMAQRFAHAEGNQEALLIDRHGKLLEGAASNIFVHRSGRLLTPPPVLGILAGRTRALVMQIAARHGTPCEESAIERRDLLMADEVFVSGSVKEIVPVVRVDGQRIADGQPGPVTLSLQKQYRQAVQDGLADGRTAAAPGPDAAAGESQ
jgi:branched-chain amino acid aminotransferase